MKTGQDEITYYPLALNIYHKLSVVVGGGRVAERKVYALQEANAYIRIVSPQLTAALTQMWKEGDIDWVPRQVQKADIIGAYLIIAATNDESVNKELSRWAHEYKIWVNVVDKPSLSTFISPAVVRMNEVVITIYTNGKDPVLARDIKSFLKENWNEFLSYRHRL